MKIKENKTNMNPINHNQAASTILIPQTSRGEIVFVHPNSRQCPPVLLTQLINNISETRLLIQQLKTQLDAALKRDEILTNVLRGYHIEM